MLTACSAPDYSPVRDWSGVASRAADYPPIVTSCFHSDYGTVIPTPLLGDSTRAMQNALSTYLLAISTLAADGVLDFREDPFVRLAGRAGAASETGGLAVATLGGLLRRATLRQSRAPQLGETIADADVSVQALITALRATVRAAGAQLAEERRAVASGYLQLDGAAGPPISRQVIRELAALRDREYAAGAAARANYDLVLGAVAEGHSLLRANSPRLSQEETARRIRAAEDSLRRAADSLPRAFATMPAGIVCPPSLPPGIVVPPSARPSMPTADERHSAAGT